MQDYFEEIEDFYDEFTQRSCDICYENGNDDQKANIDPNSDLKKERDEQTNNYKLCKQDKESLARALEECKIQIQTELAPLQSQITTLQLNVTETTELLKAKTAKLKICETDKSTTIADLGKLKIDLEACRAQNIKNNELLESVTSAKEGLENTNLDLKKQLGAEKTKNTQCEAAKQTLKDEATKANEGLEKCKGDLGTERQEKAKLQARYDTLKDEADQSKTDLESCRGTLASGSADATEQIKKLQEELTNTSSSLETCKGDLATVTTQRDDLLAKEEDLKKCEADIKTEKQGKEDCKVELSDLQRDSGQTIQELTEKNQKQEKEIISLQQQVNTLSSHNTTLTEKFTTCNDDIAKCRQLAEEKDGQIENLGARIKTLEGDNQNMHGQLQSLQATLSVAQKAKFDGYISSCNLMHERYQKYYDGATADKSWIDIIIDKFTSWFSTRYSDTKPIWLESSLKGLICDWQEQGIVREEATIRAKNSDNFEKTYSLKDMCTNKNTIENFEEDIINPCGANDGLWSYDA